MTTILIAFVFLLLLKLLTALFLDLINLRYARAQRAAVPDAFQDFIDTETYRKSIDYTTAKTRFGMVTEVYDAAVLVAVVLSGILPVLYAKLSNLLGYGCWGQAMVLFVIGVLLGLPALPFDWWAPFAWSNVSALTKARCNCGSAIR